MTVKGEAMKGFLLNFSPFFETAFKVKTEKVLKQMTSSETERNGWNGEKYF